MYTISSFYEQKTSGDLLKLCVKLIIDSNVLTTFNDIIIITQVSSTFD